MIFEGASETERTVKNKEGFEYNESDPYGRVQGMVSVKREVNAEIA